MTPNELRSLADEATHQPAGGGPEFNDEWAKIGIAEDWLCEHAPDLARLCAELGEALTQAAELLQYLVLNNIPLDEMHMQARDVRGEVEVAIARLSELEAK